MKVSLKKGVTLTEVIIGAIILSITFGGLLATFVAVRKYVKRANKRIIANDLVATQLNNLYRGVDWLEWQAGTGGLPLGTTPVNSGNSYNIDNKVYPPNSYIVNSPTGAPDGYRRVSVTINYP